MDGEGTRTWALYLGNFILDPTTGEHNASLRYHEPATGELGSGSAQFEPLELLPSGAIRPIGVRMVAKGTPPSGNVRERMYRAQVNIDPQSGTLSPVGAVPGDVGSIVTTGTSFTYQTRGFTMSGTCGPAQDP